MPIRVAESTGHLPVEEVLKDVLASLRQSVVIPTVDNRYFNLVDCPPGPYCFVIMPFDKRIVPEDVYQLGIKAAVEDADMECLRADEDLFSVSFMNKIFSFIIKADLIIADLTKARPNVLYELGVAHAFNKDVILIAERSAKRPANIQHLNMYLYGKNAINDLKRQLIRIIAQYRVERSGRGPETADTAGGAAR